MASVRILIVETEKNSAADLQIRLERLGYIVLGIASSGDEAISKTGDLNPDIVLMNIKLRGGKDGIKTGELIHLNHRKPIIYITPSASQDTIQRAGSAGTFGYIFPTMDEHQIFATIETAFSRSQLELKLDNSRKWLSGVLNSIGDGVIAMDGEGQIQILNSVAQELTGWSQSEASNKSIGDICRFVDEKTFEPIDLARAAKASDTGTGMGGSIRTALLVSNHGKAVPIEINVNLVRNDEEMITGIVLAFRDMTQHRNNLKEIEHQANLAKTLEQSASRLNKDLDTKSVLTNICDITNSALNAIASAVFLYDKEAEFACEIVLAGSQEPTKAMKAENIKVSPGVVETLITSDHPIHVEEDVSRVEYFSDPELFRDNKIKAAVIAGIYRQQQLIGVLVAIFHQSRKPLQIDELKLLGGLIDQAANSLANARLFKLIKLGRERHRLLAKSLVDVQEAERRHIASELHDHLGQLLTGIQFMLESAKTESGNKLKSSLADIQQSVSDIIEQIREMSLNLRPSMLDDMGLVPTLHWLFDRYTRQTGIKVNFNCVDFENRYPQETETTAYRIIQEALTNVARHAQVKTVFVGLAIQRGSLWVEVMDNGKGFDSSAILEKPTSGLGGMRERAILAGGYLVIRSIPDQGTQVIAALPMDERLERRKNAR
ncbi:MAG TPA: PAS domain-containing protein [Anaerolineales bacterium]|nr:PAS domain-containing protein [Anaerolineales bacterium]